MEYLALDLGASSGRAIVGTVKDGKISLDEVYRFANRPVTLGNTLYWDFLSLFDNIKEGIRAAVKKGYHLQGIAVDTWGVDFGFLDKAGKLVSGPVCYRDSRTQGLVDEVAKLVSKEKMYSHTGIQQLEINSLYQLFSMKTAGDASLKIADKLLFIPDLINYFLTGKIFNEYTIASTSQFLNAESKDWDGEICEILGFSTGWLNEIRQPCTTVGQLTGELAHELGVEQIKVYAVGSHDTASAIGAIPLEENCAFLSSGTWSLLGLTLDKPILSEDAHINDFTNEGGIDGKILFMRNITGLWLLQQLIAEWEKNGDAPYSYDYLLSECLKIKPKQSLVDSDDPCFNHPVSMKTALQEYCRKTQQAIPQTKGELVRCVLESLAVKYASVMEKLKTCTNRRIDRLFIVGGGSLNRVLNRFIADELQIEIITGITEATAIGNIIQQAIAAGEIKNLAEGHEIIKKSFVFERLKS